MEGTDVKYDLIHDGSADEVERQQPPRRRRLLSETFPFLLRLVAVCLFISVLYSYYYSPRSTRKSHHCGDGHRVSMVGNDTKVALEAHIMSKCPDARDCLQELVVPAMAQVSDLVDFKLSYIGSVDPQSDEVTCKHGPSECLGNIIELCAAKIYPDPKIYLGFVNCMTSEYRDIPQEELVKGCALEYGIEFQKLNHCISDEGNGMKLLRKSVEHSRDNNVYRSCTVRLEDKVRCVRDDGEWRDCPGGNSASELVADIEKLYKQKNAA